MDSRGERDGGDGTANPARGGAMPAFSDWRGGSLCSSRRPVIMRPANPMRIVTAGDNPAQETM